jgi:hypothetical protein
MEYYAISTQLQGCRSRPGMSVLEVYRRGASAKVPPVRDLNSYTAVSVGRLEHLDARGAAPASSVNVREGRQPEAVLTLSRRLGHSRRIDAVPWRCRARRVDPV